MYLNPHVLGADYVTLMAETEEELKSLLMMVKEESEKACSKLNFQKIKIMLSSPITSWQIDGEKVEAVTDFIFLVSKITADGPQPEIKRCYQAPLSMARILEWVVMPSSRESS